MTYSIKLDLGGLEFTVSSDTVDGLMEEYSQLEGDPTWFLSRVQEVVPLIQRGDYVQTVSHALGGTVVSDKVDEEASGVNDGGAWDRYIEDGPAQPSDGSGGRQHTDPWDDEPVEAKPAQRRSAPSRGNTNTRPSRPEPDAKAADNVYTEKDKFGREWTIGLPDAPLCECPDPEPAARMKAKAGPNAKNPGKPYTKWKCAKGAPGGDWRSKCELDEFPS